MPRQVLHIAQAHMRAFALPPPHLHFSHHGLINGEPHVASTLQIHAALPYNTSTWKQPLQPPGARLLHCKSMPAPDLCPAGGVGLALALLLKLH